jgi:spore coat protein CotH
VTEKPSLILRFDQEPKAKQAFGHKRLLLHNSTQDRSFVRWKLATELFLKADLPAPRLNFAQVQVNGRELGLYNLIQPTDKPFLAQHFASDEGNLYEGSNHDVEDKLEQDSGDTTQNQRDLQALAGACGEPNLQGRWDRLKATLDLDRFASFVAMEVLVGHHDGYSLDRNNYRIYHDPQTKCMVFIPHGMDLVFRHAELPGNGRWRGTVARAFMETKPGQELYGQKLSQLAQLVYGTDALSKRVAALAAILRPHLAQNPEARSEFEAAIQELTQVVQRRTKAASGTVRH